MRDEKCFRFQNYLQLLRKYWVKEYCYIIAVIRTCTIPRWSSPRWRRITTWTTGRRSATRGWSAALWPRVSMTARTRCSGAVPATISRTTRSASSRSRWAEGGGEGTFLMVSVLQAVTIVEGKKSVDVGVTLCNCNEDLCNEDLSGANINLPNIIIILSVPILLILTRLENE